MHSIHVFEEILLQRVDPIWTFSAHEEIVNILSMPGSGQPTVAVFFAGSFGFCGLLASKN